MSKEKLNKFMKERSGAAVTQKEADRLKALQEAKETEKRIDQRKKESLSGAAISEAEAERLKKFMPNKNVDDSEFENKMKSMQDYLNTAQKIKEDSQSYADGGEVVVGKGKDYIKDLL